MTKMRASFKSSPRHEEVKKGNRIRKKAKARKMNFDADNKVSRFEFKVSVFKEPLILCDITFVLFVIVTCIKSQCSYFTEISIV